MYCENCGSKLKEQVKFCEICGKALQNPVAETVSIPSDPRQNSIPESQPKRRKNLPFIVTAIVLVVAVGAFLIWKSYRIDLAYSWGTPMSKLLADGAKKSNSFYASFYEDSGHRADELEEFTPSQVGYHFNEDGLYKIFYFHDYLYVDSDEKYEELVQIVASHYGDNYIHVGDFYRYRATFWWKGDTVVCLEPGSITYYSEDYFIERGGSHYDEVFEFFGK